MANAPINKQQIEFYKTQIKQARELIEAFKNIDVEQMSSSKDFEPLIQLYKKYPDAFGPDEVNNINKLVATFNEKPDIMPRDVIEEIDSFMQKLYQMMNELDKVEDLLADYEKISKSLGK